VSSNESQSGQTGGSRKTFAESLRPAERRLRWFIIGWITLSTILNLINRNTLAILAPTFSSKFSGVSFTDQPGLVEKLRSHSDPVSQFLWGQFSAHSQQALMDFKATPKQQQSALMDELNKIVGVSPFSLASFTDPSGLLERLRSHSDPVSQYVWDQFSAYSQQVLADPKAKPEEQQTILVGGLNRILQGASIYDSRRFAGVTLSAAAVLALEEKDLRGAKLIRLNRLLLEDAYSGEIAKNRVLRGKPIYDTQLFAGVTLSVETRKLLEENPQGEGRHPALDVILRVFRLTSQDPQAEHLIRLNRSLLHDAYPAEIAKVQFEMTDMAYGLIIMFFQFSYAVMYVAGGRFVDVVGEKIGMTACIVWWSICTMLHALSRGVLSLGVFRFLLGVGEPGNYPAALRATARWFSKEERGLPIAIWSSGSSVGSLLSVPLIAFLALRFGWQMAFFVPGFLGIIWVAVWIIGYRMPSVAVDGPSFTAGSSTVAKADEPKPETFVSLLKDGRVWAITMARLLTDPIWVFYLSWTAKYLVDVWNFDLKAMGLYGWIPFLFGGMGGVLGGMASDWMIRRGVEPAKARKRVLYITGVIAPIAMLTGFVGSAGASIALIAVMAFICYVWFINTAALISDVFPERVVGTVLGFAAGVGQFAAIFMALLAGYWLEKTHSYTSLFFVAGSGHLLASLVLFFFLIDKPSK
jgi:ACS family hexuronate transporter-like MFS transporter